MIPWKDIDRTELPQGAGELSLHRRGEEFSIRVDGHELMNSLAHESEDALAELACRRIAERPSPRVLIGGLGMGFTLSAALGELGPGAQVEVAELMPEVVAWNREHLAEVSGNPLRDKRVTVREIDVAKILEKERAAFDAVLLDVDNGPVGLTVRSNAWLYTPKGLAATRAALRPAGVLAIWSDNPHDPFVKRLRKAGFEVEEVRARSRSRHGAARYTIWLAQKK